MKRNGLALGLFLDNVLVFLAKMIARAIKHEEMEAFCLRFGRLNQARLRVDHDI